MKKQEAAEHSATSRFFNFYEHEKMISALSSGRCTFMYPGKRRYSLCSTFFLHRKARISDLCETSASPEPERIRPLQFFRDNRANLPDRRWLQDRRHLTAGLAFAERTPLLI